MEKDFSALMQRFAAGAHQPATFQERGVLLPFTTPQLAGARIRAGNRSPAELVLTNPAGAEGVYILPWTALGDICTPTLHDRTMWNRASRLTVFSPRAVREVTLAIAAEGFAGREASRTAAAAQKTRQQARLLVHYNLLLELVRQTEPPGGVPPEKDHPANVERRARAALESLKATGSITPPQAVEALEEIAGQFVETGLRRDPTRAKLPQLCNEIAAVIEQVIAWGDGARNPEDRKCARILAQSAELTLRCAHQCLGAVHAEQDKLWLLLQQWKRDPSAIMGLAARPDWILDGWDMVCGIWRGADPANRTAAASEMTALIGILPAELRDWIGFDAPADMEVHRSGLRKWRRSVEANQDWKSGLQLETTFRNEMARAYSA